MSKEQLRKSFEEIKPTQEQKERMFQGIMKQVGSQEGQHKEKNNSSKIRNIQDRKPQKTKQWIGLAASLLVVAGISVLWQQNPMVNLPGNPPAGVQGAPDYTTGERKIMNYQGYRYAFINDGQEFDVDQSVLEKELGVVPEDATFANGGKIYELKDYHPEFRAAVQWEGKFYLVENVAKEDDGPIDVQRYVNQMDIEDRVVKVEILDHMGMELLATLNKEDARTMLNAFAQSQVANLDIEQYDEVANAQAEGKSYKVAFVLEDGTTVEHYVIPSLSYVTIGDYTCISNSLNQDIGHYFSDL